MKTTVIITIALLALSFASCTKCETCTGYYTSGYNAGKPSINNQAVKVCDKADIHAYETGTNFTDPSGVDTLKFVCK
jgi:hypothetical protein